MTFFAWSLARKRLAEATPDSFQEMALPIAMLAAMLVGCFFILLFEHPGARPLSLGDTAIAMTATGCFIGLSVMIAFIPERHSHSYPAFVALLMTFLTGAMGGVFWAVGRPRGPVPGPETLTVRVGLPRGAASTSPAPSSDQKGPGLMACLGLGAVFTATVWVRATLKDPTVSAEVKLVLGLGTAIGLILLARWLGERKW